MALHILPSSITIPVGGEKKGYFGVSSDLPGLVTLTASDPGVTLTPSSFTVGGSVANECRSDGTNRGLATLDMAKSYAANFRRNCAVGFEINFYSWQVQCYAIAGNISLYASSKTAFQFNWGLQVYPAQRLIGYSRSGLTGMFTGALPLGKTRCVVVFGDTTIKYYILSGSQTVTHASIGTDTKYGSITDSVIRLSGYYGTSYYTNVQLVGAIPSGDQTTGEIAAYLNGGNLGASLALNLPMDEESGDTAYDISGNLCDFGAEINSTSHQVQAILSGLTHTITGLTGNEQSITYDTGSVAPGTEITITATRTKAGFPTGRTPDISKETDTMAISLTAFDTTILTTWVDVFEDIVTKVEGITPSMYNSKNFQYGEVDWDDTMATQPNMFRNFELKLNSERIPKFHGNIAHEIGTCSISVKLWYKRSRGNSKRAGIFDDSVAMEDTKAIEKVLYDPLQFKDGTRCRIIKRDAISIVKEGNYSTVSIPFDLEYYWVKVPL